MNNYEFYSVLLNNISLYVWLLLIFIALYLLLFRKVIKSLINPFFLPIIYSAIGAATVFTLYFTNNMSLYFFKSYCYTQVAFLFGLFSLSLIKTPSSGKPISDFIDKKLFLIDFSKIAFHFFAFVMIASNLIVYKTKGIPLFQISRLDVYSEGTGFGFYSRLIDVSLIAVVYLYFCFYFYSLNFKKYYHLYVLLAFVFLFLSGSKTALLNIPFVFFCFLILHRSSEKVKNHTLVKNFGKIVLLFIVFAICFVLFVIRVQMNTVGEESDLPVFALFLRFVHSGDTFWYSYPNGVLLKMKGGNGLVALCNDFLGFFRIYDWKEMPPNLGIQLMQYHHPGDGTYGPNARHNVFGLLYFGYYGAILFSFIIGFLTSVLLFWLPKFFNQSLIGGIFFTFLYINLSSFELDPMLGFTYINNAIIVLPFLFVCALFIHAIIQFPQLLKNKSNLISQ